LKQFNVLRRRVSCFLWLSLLASSQVICPTAQAEPSANTDIKVAATQAKAVSFNQIDPSLSHPGPASNQTVSLSNKPNNDNKTASPDTKPNNDNKTASPDTKPDPAELLGETAEPANIWERVRKGFRLGPLDSPLVDIHTRWYADRPEYVNRMLERSRRYLYHIVAAVEKRGMPMEIALLPMVESGFNPQALSRAHAAGIWQFIPTTGKTYGLQQNAWYDGRRDITAATQAALDYLQKLFMDFGSWELALAAYNCGEGCVSRAQQRNAAHGLPTDYASLNLPVETKHYVPKLLAIKQLVLEPESFGVSVNDIPNEPYFTQVSLNAKNMDMRSAARLAGMSVDEFLSLNPAFPRRVMRADSNVAVLVPVDKAAQFQDNLQKGEWDSWQPVRAHRGETPAQLAERYHTTIARLSEHNHFKLKRDRFGSNQVVLVPVSSAAEAATDKELATWAEAEKHSFSDDPRSVSYASRGHIVRKGETIASVARKYRVSVASLKRWNRLGSAHLKVGQHLVVRQVSAKTTNAHTAQGHAKVARKSGGKTRYYTVRKGDTLAAISGRYNVAMDDLRRWNQIKGHRLQPGAKLVIKS
jgi:membrane-bound lytic murein transglycosylase D